ncbi:DNA-binding transcriptional MocR family regulator [Luteibacter sp. W1I16]|uniref:aminotransferase-like domain-containing protein n=1 Tax=Luteibacter sp. W1I16 TaxID=3373922 RepID=UPI003D235C93
MEPSYNLAVNLPLRGSVLPRLRAALASTPVDADTLAYPDPAGAPWIRASIAGWLERLGGHGPVDPARIALTIGARHALGIALAAATTDRNPSVLVEEHTYHGVRRMAHHMGTRCVDVAMDRHGMRPDALALAAARSQAAALYVQPTLQNPTTATMPLARREEIAAVAERFGLTIIEGDVYASLHRPVRDGLPPLARIAPHRTLHCGGMGKILGPGLRVGWLLHPDTASQAATTARIQLEQDGLPTLPPSIVARWMDDGTAEALLDELTGAMRERGEMARRIVGEDLVTADASLHAWLPSADAPAMEAHLLARGVHVAASKHFVDTHGRALGIRLALGAEEDAARFEEALRIVAAER